jgi:proton-translocating NADH-quinone oxidoreductase chain L
MFEMTDKLWWIPFLPFLGSAIIAVFGKAFLKGHSHWPCILGAAGACALSVVTFGNVMHAEAPLILDDYVWFQAGNVSVDFTMRADALAAVMLVTVTFIGTLIAIYASGYMHGDPGYPRFFAAVSLFLAAMTTLVLANNFILLYAGWEGVGVCSYLLIGFWFAKPSAAAAARKAFLVTRLGDIGLFLGILLLWTHCGSLEYGAVFSRAEELAGNSPTILTIACLLLFTGAVGKSAQFPLHVWLPDAMEGPSPVSALIHAATMVTAGVYLVARCTPLFGLSPVAQVTVASIGAFTALLAALIALTQTDLKRVLAYSTVSQLGYMFLALGSGIFAGKLAAFGVIAAIFHLMTHAFFKALLFLAAGSVMHAMGDVIDMRKFSGLRKVLPITHWTFLAGAAALAGVPLLSGFWSKDEILAVCWEAGGVRGQFAMVYRVLFAIGLITAGLTAFYTFRGYFMTFWGDLKIPDEAYLHHGHGSHDDHGHDAHGHADPHHGHNHAAPAEIHRDPNKKFESGPVMTIPLQILAIGALFLGAFVGPTGLFGHFLEGHWMEWHGGDGIHNLLPARLEHHHNYLLMAISSLVALGGVLVAYLLYVKNPAKATSLAASMKGLYGLSQNKFYLDELFYLLFVAPLIGIAKILGHIDTYVVDGLIDLIGQLPAALGQALKPLQNGLVQFYALLMALGVAGFMLAVLLR